MFVLTWTQKLTSNAIQSEPEIPEPTPPDEAHSVAVNMPPDPERIESSRPRIVSHRQRALYLLLILLTGSLAWWGSGYVFAYTDDAYLASDIVSITPEVSGPIEAIHVTDNEWATRGTLLFTIDPMPFQLALQQARAEEARAEAQLPVDQAQVESLRAQRESADAAAQLATVNLRRAEMLGQSDTISQQALDTARTTQAQSVAQQHAAQAALQKAAETLRLDQTMVASAAAARRLSEWRLSRTRVLAPVDGYVTHLAIEIGDMASSSQPALAIVDGSAWRVIANYKEYYLRHLHPGQIAWVWLDSHPWHLYRARIQGIAHGISRERRGDKLVPYVSPTVNWIRLQRRIPVRLTLVDSPGNDQLLMGADARVLVIY